MAKRLSYPVTGLGVLVNFWWKASLRLCAGSVEMISTFLLAAASCTARLQGASKNSGRDPSSQKHSSSLADQAVDAQAPVK